MTLELERWRGQTVPVFNGHADEVSRFNVAQYLALIEASQRYPVNAMPLPITTYGKRPAEPISASYESFVMGMLYTDGPVSAVEAYRLRVFRQAPLLYQHITDGRPGDLFDDPQLERLRAPWPGAHLGDLAARALIYADFAGNAFVADLGEELVLLRPDWVEIVLAKREYRGGQVGWRQIGIFYYEGGIQVGEGVPFLPGEYAHFVPGLPDPLANYRGLSWLTPIVREVMADKAAAEHKLAFFENAASPNLAVSLPKEITADQFRTFVDKMEEKYRGAANAYRTLYTGGGADVTVIGANMQQMDFSAVQGKGETRIANAGGVPPVLLSFSEGMQGSSLNAGNYLAAKRNFVDTTMRDLWQNWCGSLAVMDAFRPPDASRLWYDARDIPFLHEDQKDAADIQQTKAATISSYVTAGFEPQSAVDSVDADDRKLLKHSGLYSVQLQEPGAGMPPDGTGPAAADAAPPFADQARAALEDEDADVFRALFEDYFGGVDDLEFVDEIERRYNPSQLRQPKGTVHGGEWKSISSRVIAALVKWDSDGRPDTDALQGFTQPQLKAAAKQLGIITPKGMKIAPLKSIIHAHFEKHGPGGVGAGVAQKAGNVNPPALPATGVGKLLPPSGKFEVLADTGLSGDGYAPGGQWGKYGAAGVLIRHTAGGESVYLLVQRGPAVTNNKGKWQLPGGALNSKENAYQAAARETIEEVGVTESLMKALDPVGEYVYTHEPTGWKYTTIAADSPDMFHPTVDGTETSAARWFNATQIDELQKHDLLVPKLDTSIKGIIDGYPKVEPHVKSKGVITYQPMHPGTSGTLATFSIVKVDGKSVGYLHKSIGGKWEALVTAKDGSLKSWSDGHDSKFFDSKDAAAQGLADNDAEAPKGLAALIAEKKLTAGVGITSSAPPQKISTAVTGGVTGVTTVKYASPKKGISGMHFDGAKQSLKVMLNGEYVGELHQYSWGWTAETAHGTPVGSDKTKTASMQSLLAKHKVEAEVAAKAKAAAEAKAAEAKIAAENLSIAKGLKPPKNMSKAEKLVRSGDFSQLKQVSGAKGSNEGGVFEAPDGTRWYVKAQGSPEHADNEVLASAFYRAAGIDIPEVIKGSGAPGLSGSNHTATRYLIGAKSNLKEHIKGADQGVARDRAFVRKVHEGFAVDAWLANWDIAGLNYDNIVSASGEPVRIDAGGALLFRAMGTPKGDAFGPRVTEWDVFTDKTSDKPSAALFDTITSHDMVASANRVKAITPAKIRSMVKAHGLSPDLAETLIARRKDIISRAKFEASKPPKPFAEGALTENAALNAVPLTMHNMKSQLVDFGETPEHALDIEYSVNTYKGSGYGPINLYLLGKNDGSASAASYSMGGKATTAVEHAHNIDDAFKHARLNTDIVVHRGERNPGRNFPEGEWSLKGGMEGKEWTFPAYASTSTEVTTAIDFATGSSTKPHPTAQPTVMRIVVPKGTAVIALDQHYGSESEVLLDRGLRYRVVKDYGVRDGVRDLDVMVVN